MAYRLDMGLALALGALVVLLALPVVRAVTNPVVSVADHLTTAMPYDEADLAVVALLQSARGYDVALMAPGTYRLSYRRTPAWAIVLGILTFPLGIVLILLARETFTLTVSLVPAQAGTRVTVVGKAHRSVAEGVGEGLQCGVTPGASVA
jgi:hypothetical protein